jgi:hypothetical protein
MAEPNDYDRAARYLAKSDPAGFFGWALGLTPSQFRFVRWLDTRTIGSPGATDRTGDTVGYLAEVTAGGRPWALPLEFQAAPDPEMFGRLLEYLGRLWRVEKPSPERGDRFWVGAVVVNLTGAGDASRTMEWPEARLATTLRTVERNLERESATDLVTGIASGTIGRTLLPLVPLMNGGTEPAIINSWVELAQADPDQRRVGQHGALARVFARATQGHGEWLRTLKEWNMTRSPVVDEWRAEGRVQAQTAAVLSVLEAKFQSVPADLAAKIQETTDEVKLKAWLPLAVLTSSVEKFRADAGL